ncbi:MAG TPA: DUF86 domain-containing protein [Sediminispirochaeta sp.]|nr:DUF86 domain-containing protein [Sediminispirochaeta sp.]
MNDLILNKIVSIQRCVKRARDEYAEAGADFLTDYTRQDAAILNLMRACEQAIDLANHLVKGKKLGVPTDSAESFELLAREGIVPPELASHLKKMIGFRNTVIHEYQTVNMEIVRTIITEDTADLIRFTELLLPHAE